MLETVNTAFANVYMPYTEGYMSVSSCIWCIYLHRVYIDHIQRGRVSIVMYMVYIPVHRVYAIYRGVHVSIVLYI